MTNIDPQLFARELEVAGLLGLPFSWSSDGHIEGRDNLTQAQNATLDAVIAAHDPDPAPTLEEVKAAKIAEAERFGGSIMAQGYHKDFGEPHGVQVLQLRPGTDDRENWTNGQLGYLVQVTAGNGAVVGAKIRVESNINIMMSFADALTLLSEMLAWGQGFMDHSWALKDAINACTTVAEVEAIDITTGWPE